MPVSPARSDEDLATLAQQGDGAAEIELVRRYRWIAQAKSRRYFLAGADAEDVEQEALIGLCLAIRSYLPDRRASFETFADLCMTRQVLTAVTRASCRKHQPLNVYVPIDRPPRRVGELKFEDQLADSSLVDPAEQLVHADESTSMQSWLAGLLSRLELDVLRLYLEGKSYDEIAAQLARDVRCVDNALQRARARIRRSAAIFAGEQSSSAAWSFSG